ncbi:hypothetical protein COY95_04855 [Candidatus Woesearchaeota archaeon CG_4_10_14_0_8_um_filter_47_5]|nr:MAG: hypothetical protein COY95_04855 [Candidatus Woesearchaeota archaeon CG_4_10_14_0_8_um_filter_47_5]
MTQLREWIAENIGYRFTGCAYNKTHDHLFTSLEPLIPARFFRREIADLGCGDGGNTLRIKKIFRARMIRGYERNEYLIARARKKGIVVKKMDLQASLPYGEMATFTFSLHHLPNKEEVLKKVMHHFKYLFLIEPTLDLYHSLFDACPPLKRTQWIALFNTTLGRYDLHIIKNNVVVFYSRD